VHCWADWQSVHGFHCHDNIAPNTKFVVVAAAAAAVTATATATIIVFTINVNMCVWVLDAC